MGTVAVQLIQYSCIKRVQLHQKEVAEKFNIEDTDEIIKEEAERFLLLFEKTFNEYHEKKLKEENLDCEHGIITDFLTKVAKKIRQYILSDAQGSKAEKFLKIIYSFFQSVFNTVCSCHVTYAFQIESTLYTCLNVKELLARSRPEI